MRYGQAFLALVAASILGASACGGSSASDDCDKLVDAFAKTWSRCMKGTYDDQKKTWGDAFNCGKANNSNESQVDQCVAAVNALDCNAVNSGTSPGVCTGAVTQ